MNDRWTDETRELVADAIANADSLTGTIGPAVLAVLTALADAGLLTEPGGETREEWANLSSNGTLIIRRGRGEGCRANALEDATRFGSVAARRTVHIGPWREASDVE